MTKYVVKDDGHIDTLHLVFYAGDTLEETTLMTMRNKRVIRQWYGKEALQLYNLLSKKENK